MRNKRPAALAMRGKCQRPMEHKRTAFLPQWLDLLPGWQPVSVFKSIIPTVSNMRARAGNFANAIRRIVPSCAVLLLVLQGCTLQIESAPKDVQFDAKSPDSLVILGSRIEEKACEGLENYTAFFGNFDPKTKIINGSFSDRKEYGDRIQCLSFFKPGCICKGVHWHLYRVPAGEHALLSLISFKYGVNYVTVFTKTGFHSLGRRAITGDKIHGFRTEPGKAYYLGNFVFDLESFPARIIQYYRDDDGVHAHLKMHSNVASDVEYIRIELPDN